MSEARTRYVAYASRLRVGCPENYDFPKLCHYYYWIRAVAHSMSVQYNAILRSLALLEQES